MYTYVHIANMDQEIKIVATERGQGGLRWSELCLTSRAADAKWQSIKSDLQLPVTPSLSCVLIFPKPLPCSAIGLPSPNILLCSRTYYKIQSVDTIFYLNQLSHTNPDFQLLLKNLKIVSPHSQMVTTGGAERWYLLWSRQCISSTGQSPPNLLHFLYFLSPV